MTRQELESWLCGDGAPLLTPAEIAAVLGVAPDAIADTAPLHVPARLAGVRFTLAVLRDVFADDRGVRWWLRQPRPELRGRTGIELLLGGQPQAVEELAVREWNRPGAAPGASGPTDTLARIA